MAAFLLVAMGVTVGVLLVRCNTTNSALNKTQGAAKEGFKTFCGELKKEKEKEKEKGEKKA